MHFLLLGQVNELGGIHQRPQHVFQPLTPVRLKCYGRRIAFAGPFFEFQFDAIRFFGKVVGPGNVLQRFVHRLPRALILRNDSLIEAIPEQVRVELLFLGGRFTGQHTQKDAIDQLAE